MAPAHPNPKTKPQVATHRTSRDAMARGREQHRTATVSYFERRARSLDVVATTETPTGQTVDWVPVECQAEGDIAMPPARPETPEMSPDRTRRSQPARFELHDDAARRGPEGTVPILRKKLTAISGDQPLSEYLSRRPAWAHRQSMLAPLDEGVGGHHYALTGQRAVAYGAGGAFSVVAPYTETSADFSLLQLGIVNDSESALQSAEAGVQVMQRLYGDWDPHLFVYFTTNGYAGGGDDIGGYNRDVTGWIQVDGLVYPGAGFAATSTPGGDQHDVGIRFELHEGNWWLLVGDTWVGYYPASLYEGTRSPYDSLADHATWVNMMGEVFDSEAVAGPTSTDMGSGQWADAQWPWAAYQRNLTIQVEPGGGLQDYNPDGLLVSSPAMYGLETHMLSGSEWGSYQYLGGPGAG